MKNIYKIGIKMKVKPYNNIYKKTICKNNA